MNERMCLEWCLEYGHRFPDDYRTAQHVRDWLADKAAEWAWSDEERMAVNVARSAALDLIRSRGCDGSEVRCEAGETNGK